MGDFEKRAAISRRRSASNSRKSDEHQVRSTIPKSLRLKSDFQSSLNSSIPEVLLKRANLEKELKALKSVLKNPGDDADFNVDEYTTLDARNKWASQNGVQPNKVLFRYREDKKQIYGEKSY